ncbi:MAG: UDP-N-acetylmuramyl-tripeptide synthetase [Micrococcaceae bacterium]|nr:UDP-N-acetylmuramyl-tripeptide synthetase [Micrococcaceae bacterium]
MTTNQPSVDAPEAPLRPSRVEPVPLAELVRFLDARLHPDAGPSASDGVAITGASLDSRRIQPGDLYFALPGAHRHGAEFAAAAVAAGAVAVLTDTEGTGLLRNASQPLPAPVLEVDEARRAVGPAAGFIYGRSAADIPLPLFAVTGTNGKTTTTYLLNSLLNALGHSTGLIGTIEILAGSEAIPSTLTTPESPDIHALLALMRERRLGAASMEVSSHAVAYRRVDGVVFDVAGFTNLTQDHLDLHGTMAEYFATKAQLFTPAHSRRAVVTVDDEWGRRMAAASTVPTTTLLTSAPGPGIDADWQVTEVEPAGLGHQFLLRGPDGATLRAHTSLPGHFNVANAALALVMVATSGVPLGQLQAALTDQDPLSVQVPGRMQLVAAEPVSVVDFAHNPDALERALQAVRPADPQARLIIVFGATGQRDASKRPTMGAVAARFADIIIVTDDDPHDEDPAGIRAAVRAGAEQASAGAALERTILEVYPRAEAITRAVELATRRDTILVAGRGHEVWQEVQGVNLALDDRVELRRALARSGFTDQTEPAIES